MHKKRNIVLSWKICSLREMPATFTRLFYLKYVVLHIPSSRKDVSRKLITTLLNTKRVKLSQASHSKWILQHREENAIIFIIFYNNVLQAHEVVKKRYLASIQRLFIAYKTTHAENRLHYGTVVNGFWIYEMKQHRRLSLWWCSQNVVECFLSDMLNEWHLHQ